MNIARENTLHKRQRKSPEKERATLKKTIHFLPSPTSKIPFSTKFLAKVFFASAFDLPAYQRTANIKIFATTAILRCRTASNMVSLSSTTKIYLFSWIFSPFLIVIGSLKKSRNHNQVSLWGTSHEVSAVRSIAFFNTESRFDHPFTLKPRRRCIRRTLHWGCLKTVSKNCKTM